MTVELTWLLTAGPLVVLAVAGGAALRGRGPTTRLAGSVVLAALAAAFWVLWVQGVTLSPDAVTTALGLSVSFNVAFVAWLVASSGLHDSGAHGTDSPRGLTTNGL